MKPTFNVFNCDNLPLPHVKTKVNLLWLKCVFSFKMSIWYSCSVKPVQIYLRHETPKVYFLQIGTIPRYTSEKSLHKWNGLHLNCRGTKVQYFKQRPWVNFETNELEKAEWVQRTHCSEECFLLCKCKILYLMWVIGQRMKIKWETESNLH